MHDAIATCVCQITGNAEFNVHRTGSICHARIASNIFLFGLGNGDRMSTVFMTKLDVVLF